MKSINSTSKKDSSDINQAPEIVGKNPYRLFGPNLLDPSRLIIPDKMYLESYIYSALKNADNNLSLNSQEPTLFK